jgi:hypothetical protein
MSKDMIFGILVKMGFNGPFVLAYDPEGKYPVLEEKYSNLWNNQLYIVDASAPSPVTFEDTSQKSKVIIRTLSGNNFEINVNPNDPEDLKLRIQQLTGMRPEIQRLQRIENKELEFILRSSFRPLDPNLTKSDNWVYDESNESQEVTLYQLDRMFRPM